MTDNELGVPVLKTVLHIRRKYRKWLCCPDFLVSLEKLIKEMYELCDNTRHFQMQIKQSKHLKRIFSLAAIKLQLQKIKMKLSLYTILDYSENSSLIFRGCQKLIDKELHPRTWDGDWGRTPFKLKTLNAYSLKGLLHLIYYSQCHLLK